MKDALERPVINISCEKCGHKMQLLTNNKKFVYIVKTESCDTYTYKSIKRLSKKQLAKKVWQDEGKIASLSFYEDTILVSEQKL